MAIRAPAPIALGSAPVEPFRELLMPDEWKAFVQTMRQSAARLKGRTLWNINSTAQGGGVAEMLSWQIPYERDVGMDVRWLVIQGDHAFFSFTKRLHALLHGVSADGSTIQDAERTLYRQTLASNARALLGEIRSGDVVILHDPQTAGLVRELLEHGCRVIWRCHIGVDQPNEIARAAWRFLLDDVGAADATIFSRRAYVWAGLRAERVQIIPPAIDAFSPKNQELDGDVVEAVLRRTGILAGASSTSNLTVGAISVARRTDLVPAAPIPDGVPLVVQVSRWDRLKDPVGVMDGFARFVAPEVASHLVLAGPGVSSVADDPEEEEVLRQVNDRWQGLPGQLRDRVHLARLPTDDSRENAVIVNALQRRAQLVVQKSIREGFGLTVAEAMWKARPLVASRVGGIQDQIEDGRSGILVDDPRDLAAFGGAVVRLLSDPAEAERLGAAAKVRVRRDYLAPRLMMRQAELVTRLLSEVD
jgi:trehalose synthase